MESKSHSLKQTLTCLFGHSKLLRNPCNSITSSSTSIFSSSAANSSSRSLSNDTIIAHIPTFIPHNKNTNKDSYDNINAKTENKKKKNTKILLSNSYGFTSSSEDEDETTTFFSIKSFSLDSSDFYKRPSKRKHKSKKQAGVSPRRAQISTTCTTGIPVMKRSKDPYMDFCDSIVEMIVERHMFGAKDFERLLHCYLSLNSPTHHSVILGAFADISEVLFGC